MQSGRFVLVHFVGVGIVCGSSAQPLRAPEAYISDQITLNVKNTKEQSQAMNAAATCLSEPSLGACLDEQHSEEAHPDPRDVGAEMVHLAVHGRGRAGWSTGTQLRLTATRSHRCSLPSLGPSRHI